MTAPNAPGGLKLTHPERLHAFVKWVMLKGCWNGSDLDGGQIQKKALELDLLIKEPYDPEVHGESEFDIEPGDDWCRLDPLRAERDAKDAEIARLKEENARLYRQYTEDWHSADKRAADAEARLAAMAEDDGLKEPYVPCVAHFPEAGISEFVQEDVAIVWKWLGDGVQAGYAMDDGRLVGVQWPIVSRPAPADAVAVLVEALREACDLLSERVQGSAARSPGHNARVRMETALSDPRVIAAQSADPAKPSPFDGHCCMPRDGGPFFVLLGRDPQAGPLVRKWAEDRAQRKPDDDKIAGAREIAARMMAYAGVDAQSADPWLPIASAPKDGTQMDLWVRPHDAFANGNAGRIANARFQNGRFERFLIENWLPVANCGEPIAWMPLPVAPARQQEEPS